MKKLLAIMMVVLPMMAGAQNPPIEDLIDEDEPIVIEKQDVQKDSIKPTDVCFLTGKDGWYNKQNANRNFTVWEIKGKSAKDLYESAFSYLSRKFSSPYGKTTGTPYSSITINGMTSENDGIVVNGSYFCDTEFSMMFEFKDNKIRFNYPILGRLHAHINSYKTSTLQPRTIEEIERDKQSYSMYFERYIRKLMLDLISHLENTIENDW